MAATANIRQTSVADLVSMIGSSSTGIAPLILDTRSSTLYAENHILNAVCLSLPKVLLKRIQKGIAGSNLDELVVCDKDLLSRRKTGCAVVVYDDNGLLDDVTASAVLSVLINEGITPLYLQGMKLVHITHFNFFIWDMILSMLNFVLISGFFKPTVA
jgi:hypothetical protein